MNDYYGIHKLICTQLIPLRNPDAALGSEEERAEQNRLLQKQRVELLRISQQQAYKFLFEGQFALAIPAALQSLRFSMQISGSDSIDLVPSYLILGEASIGLKKYIEAEDYLSLAKWAILKAQNAENTLLAKLHRNFGQLYAAQELYDKALYQLALDVYHSSLATNPEDITVTSGYYQMGMIFHQKGRTEDAAAFYDKVILIWSAKWTSSFVLDVAQAAEAIQMLSTIIKFRTLQSPNTVKNAIFTLAKIHFSATQIEKAKDLGSKALDAFESALGREHSTTVEVRNFLKIVNAITTKRA